MSEHARHQVRVFQCVGEPGIYRAVCNTCGWMLMAEQEYTEAEAEKHRGYDQHYRPARREPPLRRAGFVSGLPDREPK